MLLNEGLTVLKALGALLVLAGAVLAQVGPRKARLSGDPATGPAAAARRR